ncbi:MAG TPA: protease inhibitor I42 family protein [Spirochaetota bacterium]|nr:protease inhibitor I42 family protein [Spirochaetota bacterium]HOM38500.1 protease inhibitor I42 family protein [Spirochaetota bacterium]HPQ49040.1 protease inhibitor I42 family protein [Spirochaetota bacterium]
MHKTLTLIIFMLIITMSFILNKCSNKNTKEEYEKLRSSYRSISPDEKIVMKGEYFIVELDLNAGTGYDWYLDKIGDNITYVKREVFSFGEEKNGDIMVGGPLKVVFLFRAEKEGKSKIEFKLYRNWEKDKIEENRIYELEIK